MSIYNLEHGDAKFRQQVQTALLSVQTAPLSVQSAVASVQSAVLSEEWKARRAVLASGMLCSMAYSTSLVKSALMRQWSLSSASLMTDTLECAKPLVMIGAVGRSPR